MKNKGVIEEEDFEQFDGRQIITFGDKKVILKTSFFDEDVDTDRILKIDATNILAEILTFNVVVNRFGIVLANAERDLSYIKMKHDILEATEKDAIRKAAVDEIEAGDRKKMPTVDEVDTLFTKSKKYLESKTKVLDAEKTRDILQSIFWSAKSKANLLEKLSTTIKSDEISELSNTVINGIQIRVREDRMRN